MKMIIALLCLRLAFDGCGNSQCTLCFPLSLQVSELQTHS
jgi:hypothetical protein